MKIFLSICGVISFLINMFTLYYAIKLYYSDKRAKRVLTSTQVYTIGLFISVILLYIPIYYTTYAFGDGYAYLRPILLAIHDSLKIFFLDADFKMIKTLLERQPEPLRVLYSLYCAVIYVVAPIMTFTNVLSLFKNIKGEFRFWYHKYKKTYIFSELNQKAVALAKNIYERDRKSVIVFTDVFEQNEEVDFELLTEVRDIKAICLKRDVSHLNIMAKKGDVEIFLIGTDESENVSQAVKITTELNKYNKKHNVKVFVFSSKESSAYILDSVKYKNLLDYASKNDYKSSFKLRRINEVRQLAWNTVSSMNVFEVAKKNNNTISILIAGMGSYGMEFFKTLVWFCQFEGFKLKITIIDKLTEGDDGKRDIESVINHQCPELLGHNRSAENGEAYYDIEILSGIDLNNSSFEEIALYSGDDRNMLNLAKRIKETNIAIISLGDDDLNIETSVRFRGIFDRIHDIKADDKISLADEKVQIYAIVYDEQKSGILHCNDSEKEVNYLVNHCEVPYHIHFIGGISSQFDYGNIYNPELEEKAYEHHLGWVKILYKIYKEQNLKVHADNLEKEYSKPIKQEEEKKKYEEHEYYRLSSMSKEIYQRAINASLASFVECINKNENGEMLQTCKCENCVRRKKSEHMRWNAYTRTIGYSHTDGKRADRAKLHNNLVSWDKLSDKERMKD